MQRHLKLEMNQIENMPLSIINGGGAMVPVILCEKYQDPLWIGFGCVRTNDVARKTFRIANPHMSLSMEILIESIPTKIGVSVSFTSQKSESNVAVVPPGNFVEAVVTWCPPTHMSIRDVVTLTCNNSIGKLHLTLHGISGKGDVSIRPNY